jgi:hypothetical protein
MDPLCRQFAQLSNEDQLVHSVVRIRSDGSYFNFEITMYKQSKSSLLEQVAGVFQRQTNAESLIVQCDTPGRDFNWTEHMVDHASYTYRIGVRHLNLKGCSVPWVGAIRTLTTICMPDSANHPPDEPWPVDFMYLRFDRLTRGP